MTIHVDILHEYGAPAHFVALRHLEAAGRVTLDSCEFNLVTQARRLAKPQKAKPARLVHNVRMLRRLLAGKDQTIVIGAAPFDPIIPFLLRLKRRNHVIYYTSWADWRREADVPKNPVLPALREQWFDFLDGLDTIAVTEATRDALLRVGANARQIPHGVDTNVFSPPETKPPEEPRVVLFVGRMLALKGFSTLIDVIRNHDWPNTEFWFVGRGPFDSEIHKLAESHPVRHLGYVGDPTALADIYRRASVLVLPSEFEAFGIVLIEAMACGVPPVTTDAYGPREVVDDGVTGRVVPRGDGGALREALEELLADADLRRKLGQNGREKVLRSYDIEVVAGQWWDVLASGRRS